MFRGCFWLEIKKFNIVCGHYGCGKTNLSINLAVNTARKGEAVTLVDFDIVNPYFRSSDYAKMLTGLGVGVNVISTPYSGSTVDLPMIAAEVYSIFDFPGTVIIDVGGDDAGATALGQFAERIGGIDYDMLYVVNRYRALSTKPEEAVALLWEIESASHLKVTAIVNNSHVMSETTPEMIREGLLFADEVSALTGIPVKFTTIPRFLESSVDFVKNTYPVDIYVKPPWVE